MNHNKIRRVAAMTAVTAALSVPVYAMADGSGMAAAGPIDPAVLQATVIGSPAVAIRTVPSTRGTVAYVRSAGARLPITCTTSGSSVSGPYGSSTTWFRVGVSRWVPGARVSLDAHRKPIPGCLMPGKTERAAVNTSGGSLNVRTTPYGNGAVAYRLKDGAAVTITCRTPGVKVTGTYGTTNTWNRIGNSRWISDAYVRHAGSARAPWCAM